MLSIERARSILAGFLETGGSVQQRAVRGVGWLLLSNWLTKAILFGQTIILVRLLTPADFGLMGILFVITGTIAVFTSPGIETALIQRKEPTRIELDTSWAISVARGIVKCGLLSLIAPYMAEFYGEPSLDPAIKVFAVTYLLGGFRNIGTVGLTREMNFKRISLSFQVTRILQMMITLAFAFTWRNFWALIAGQVAGEILALVASYIIHPYRPSFHFDLEVAKNLFRFARHVLFSGIVIYVINNGDDALVGKVLGIEALGFYTLAYGLATMPSDHVMGVIGQIMFPAFARFQGQIASLRKSYLTTLRFVSLITMPACVGAALLAPEIIQVVYGSRWLPMVDPLRVLCIFGMIRSIVSISGSLFQGVGRPNYLTYVSFAQLIIMAAIIYPLTVAYGILGTAIAVVVPMVAVQGWAMRRTAELIEQPLGAVLRVMRLPLAATATMAVVVLMAKTASVQQPSVTVLLSLIVIGVAVYAMTIYVMDRSLVTEVKQLLGGLA